MLRLSKLADYAVMIVVAMDKHQQSHYSASQLVDLTHLNLPTIRKILNALTLHGVVTSKRGTDGGYYLVIPANQLTLLKVIESIDGKVSVTECCEDQREINCSVGDCITRPHWRVINEKMRDLLMNIYISELSDAKTETTKGLDYGK